MQASEQVETILQVLMNASKEIISKLSEAKAKVDTFVETILTEEEQKLQQIPHSKFEQILSENALNFEITAQSDTINSQIMTLIDIKGTNMIISGDEPISIAMDLYIVDAAIQNKMLLFWEC